MMDGKDDLKPEWGSIRGAKYEKQINATHYSNFWTKAFTRSSDKIFSQQADQAKIVGKTLKAFPKLAYPPKTNILLSKIDLFLVNHHASYVSRREIGVHDRFFCFCGDLLQKRENSK